LSSARAKAVADYLIAKGISRERIQYRGYGKRQPIDTNETPEGRRRNQRVEIKIISFGD
jgi:outer membrane protein OmpA-like peptidoglycan-associated protein